MIHADWHGKDASRMAACMPTAHLLIAATGSGACLKARCAVPLQTFQRLQSMHYLIGKLSARSASPASLIQHCSICDEEIIGNILCRGPAGTKR